MKQSPDPIKLDGFAEVLFRASLVALIVADQQGRIVLANPAAESLFGYATDEFLEQSVDSLVPSDMREGHGEYRSEYQKSHECRPMGVARLLDGVHKSGDTIPVEVGLTSIEHEGHSLVMATIVDLTERKANEAQLQRSIDESQIVIDALPAQVFVKDLDNRILRVNRAVAESLDMPREQIEGRPSEEIYPKDAKRFHADDLSVIASGKPRTAYLQPIAERWTQTDKIPIRNREGVIDKILVVASDITELKEAVESEKTIRRQLEKTGEIAKVGGWEVILGDDSGPIWSPEVCRMHEVEEGFQPTLEQAINFYTAESRPVIEQAVQDCIENQRPWDVEATIKTAKGNLRRVRAAGEPEVVDGKCVRLWGTFQDITDNDRVKKDLLRSKFAIDHSYDAIYWVRKDGSFFYVNNAACEMLGHTREELLNLTVVDLDPMYPPDVWAKHWERTKRERQVRLETKHFAADGEAKWVEMNIHFYTFENEEFIVGTARDITENQKVQLELAESEDRYNWLMKNANLGWWDWDVATNEVVFGEITKTQLGYPADQEWKTFDEWQKRVHPDDLEGALERASQLAEKPHELYDSAFRLRTADGSYRWIRSIGRGVCDESGQLKRCMGVHVDIHEAHKAQQELLASESRYRTLFEDSPQMHLNVDVESGCIRDCNRLLVRQLGFKEKSEVVGKQISEMYDESCHADLDEAFQTFRTEGKVKNRELLVRTKTGTKIPIILNVSAVRDEAGEILYSSATWSDITELKSYTRKLERANEELERFAYVASHDLRSPLRAIEHLASWVVEDLQDHFTDASTKHMAELRNRVARMERLLDDLLAYSRAGRVRSETKTIQLDSMTRSLDELLDLKGRFEIISEFQINQFVGFYAPFETVLRNLVANAAKHHDQEQGAIFVSTKPVLGQPSMIQIQVADDGPGIAPQFHDRVFEMFQTLKTCDFSDGSGMGLSLAKKLVEAEGGKIWIEPNLPRGTRVCFTWPKSVSIE